MSGIDEQKEEISRTRLLYSIDDVIKLLRSGECKASDIVIFDEVRAYASGNMGRWFNVSRM